MLDGLYTKQMNRAQLIEWHKYIGRPYSTRWTKAELLESANEFAKEYKAQKRTKQ